LTFCGLRFSVGDGDPENTETPFVAWGAGVAKPVAVTVVGDRADDVDGGGSDAGVGAGARSGVTTNDNTLKSSGPATATANPFPLRPWHAQNMLARSTVGVDMEQADVAPLLAALLGVAPPVNSVGAQ
jgi:hypothetical protein